MKLESLKELVEDMETLYGDDADCSCVHWNP